jgi:putative membrane protein
LQVIDSVASAIALIHVYVFALESLLWGKPISMRTFGTKPEAVEITRPFAYNQGFYNLFLVIAIVVGFVLISRGDLERGRILIDYACASVFAAGAVLLSSGRRYLRPAMVQVVPAAIYFLLRSLG